jgi:hypothetical protein
MSNRPRRRRGVGTDDDDPRALHRTSSGSYDSPGYGSDPESDDGTPQPEFHGQVEQMWPQGMVASGSVSAPAMRYDEGQMAYHDLAGQHLMGDQAVMERIPPNATLLQGLPQSHPSQQFSSPHMHSMAGYAMPMSGGAPMNIRRASDQNYDYRPGPSYRS